MTQQTLNLLLRRKSNLNVNLYLSRMINTKTTAMIFAHYSMYQIVTSNENFRKLKNNFHVLFTLSATTRMSHRVSTLRHEVRDRRATGERVAHHMARLLHIILPTYFTYAFYYTYIIHHTHTYYTHTYIHTFIMYTHIFILLLHTYFTSSLSFETSLLTTSTLCTYKLTATLHLHFYTYNYIKREGRAKGEFRDP